MTILASVITAQAAGVLNDPAGLRWSSTELLDFLNLARRAAAQLRPDMFVKTVEVALAAGARQALPSDGQLLFRVNANVGGDAIVPVDRAHLDARLPNWRTAAPSATVRGFMYDPSTPLEYWVTPPSAGGSVEITYAYAPADIASGEAIGCADVYQPALLDYVLFRAFSKPVQGGQAEDTARAVGHYSAFVAALTPKAAA